MGYPAVLTFWFVNAADPAAVLSAEPRADRGFGRKLLAHINPAWPITTIGEFPLNRSSQPGRAEFYIAGYPGVAVVQTFVEDVSTLSDAAAFLRDALPAADTYVFAMGTDSDFAGLAHFTGHTVRRALSATREMIIEDIGLPDPCEAPYWAGEKSAPLGGISLPFAPKDLALAAQEEWIGIDISPEGPTLHVVGYAVDARPEPKIATTAPQTKTVTEVAARFASKDRDYDDYEVVKEEDAGAEFAQLADAALAAAQRTRRGLLRRSKNLWAQLKDRIRHSDRD